MPASHEQGDSGGSAAEQARQVPTRPQDIGGLRSVIANLDDYKLRTPSTCPSSSKYADDSPSRARQGRRRSESGKRFFVAVEGSPMHRPLYYNGLRPRRADAVVSTRSHQNIPIYRIPLGLGEQKPSIRAGALWQSSASSEGVQRRIHQVSADRSRPPGASSQPADHPVDSPQAAPLVPLPSLSSGFGLAARRGLPPDKRQARLASATYAAHQHPAAGCCAANGRSPRR
jgi:hypothetical protein